MGTLVWRHDCQLIANISIAMVHLFLGKVDFIKLGGYGLVKINLDRTGLASLAFFITSSKME